MRESFSSVRARQQPLERAAKGPAQADLDLDHAQQVSRALAHPLQIHVVDAHHLAAVNVDDLAVDQVLLQIEVIALIVERGQRLDGAQFQRAGGGLHHLVRGHNAQPVPGLQHQSGDLARIRAGGHGNVLEPAAQMALRVGHRSAEQRRQRDAGCGARGHEESVSRRGRDAPGDVAKYEIFLNIG